MHFLIASVLSLSAGTLAQWSGSPYGGRGSRWGGPPGSWGGQGGWPVNTTTGRFVPITSQTYPNVSQYLDIPYGQPPLGDLRFAAPVAANYNSTPVQATYPAPACLQYYSSAAKSNSAIYNIATTQFTNTSEDCLHLAVYAPKRDHEYQNWNRSGYDYNCSQPKLPVMVFIYGGNFLLGGYSTPAYNPSEWIQSSQEHIVVALNYRVNVLGFPNAAGLAAENNNLNFGLLDQRLALEWVRDNIEQFGGDPDQITLWGQSAGAFSVDYLTFAYPDDPIARAIILESGNAIANPGKPAGNSGNFTTVANALGCTDTDPASQLSCMRAVPTDQFANYIESTTNAPAGFTFGPLADDVTAFSNYTTLLQSGSFAKLPVLTGTNTQEGFAFLPFLPTPVLPANLTAIANNLTLKMFQCPELGELKLKDSQGVNQYLYQYAGNFTDISPRPWLGAYHTAELPIIFGTLDWDSTASPPTQFQMQLSSQMQELWLSFVKDPLNGPQSLNWPTTSSGMGIELGLNDTLQQPLAISSLGAQCASLTAMTS